jgi:hypothetical protein
MLTNEKISTVKTASFKEWKNPEGKTFYYYNVTLENGDKGDCCFLSKDPQDLQTGKSLTYFVDDKGNLKIQKPKTQRPPLSSAQKSNPASFALSYAKDLAN